MTVTVYRHTDSGAPVLNATAGSLVALLDAVLVNGYGAKSPLGWTKPFTGTNGASFKQPAGTTNGFYLNVDDNNPNTDAFKTARMTGYESMSAFNTGTAPFPAVAQLATAVQWPKQNEASTATPVNWTIVGTNKFFFFWVRILSTHVAAPGGDMGRLVGFGDILSYKVPDAYATLITGYSGSGSAVITTTLAHLASNNAPANAASGHFMTRSYTQSGGAIGVGQHTDYVKGVAGSSFMGSGSGSLMPYPTGPDASLYTAPVWITESTTKHLRGIIPGLYAPLHNIPLTTGDVFTGTVGSPLAGKTLEAFTVGHTASAGSYGQMMIETSNTW